MIEMKKAVKLCIAVVNTTNAANANNPRFLFTNMLSDKQAYRISAENNIKTIVNNAASIKYKTICGA